MIEEAFARHYLKCPMCGRPGLRFEHGLSCPECGRDFPAIDGLVYLCRDDIREFARSGARLTESELGSSRKPDPNLVTLANIDYHNRIAGTYEQDMSSRAYLAEGSPTQSRIAEVVEVISKKTGTEFWLDVGCGTGNVLRHTTGKFKHSIGIDVAPEMLKIAMDRGFDVFTASADELPFQNGTADVVSAVSLVHHLGDPAKFFEEAARVLKPGGYLYTDWDPNAEACVYLGPHSRSRLIRKLWPLACRFVATVKGLQTEQQEDEQAAVARIAEYHRAVKPGLIPDEVEQRLIASGFENPNIYFHDNATSLFAPLRLSLLTRAVLWMQGKFVFGSPSRFAPQFAILAKKERRE